jgi:hypothetical protein
MPNPFAHAPDRVSSYVAQLRWEAFDLCIFGHDSCVTLREAFDKINASHRGPAVKTKYRQALRWISCTIHNKSARYYEIHWGVLRKKSQSLEDFQSRLLALDRSYPCYTNFDLA